MKILILAKGYAPDAGGIEAYSAAVAKAYAGLGHQVTVLTAYSGPRGWAQPDGYSIFNVGTGSQAGVFARFMIWLLFHNDMRFDFIHATTWRVGVPAILLWRRIPLTVSLHGRELFIVPRIYKPIMRKVLRDASALPTVSTPILVRARQVLGMTLPQAYPNWNGARIDIPRASHRRASKPLRIFCLCRLVKRKNVVAAIRAVGDLIHQGYDVAFDIAGSGDEYPRLARLITDIGCSDHIQLHGAIPDDHVAKLYQGAHVFLHPHMATEQGNDIEGFGLAIADAMAFGCVPVVGASGGPMDYIEQGVSGFLVDGSDRKAICDCITVLYDDPKKRAAMSKSAQQFAARYLTWDNHVRNILKQLEVSADRHAVRPSKSGALYAKN